MTGGKKWLVILTDEQHEWIKETAKETGLKGSDIVREMLDRTMNEDEKRFKSSLAQTHLKNKLQMLNDRKAALEEEARELKKQLGGGERVAV